MTRFSDSEASGHLGVAAAKTAVFMMEWAFREQPLPDFGIDGQIEIVDSDRKATGRLIGCQVKSGPSYFDEKTSSGIVYRGDSEHLAYWLGHSLPVIVILHDQENDCCYWQVVDRKHVENTGKGWKIEVPFSQVLDAGAKTSFERLADTGWLESVRTFTTADRFFRRFETNPLFDFSQTILGRDSHLKALAAFLGDPDLTVAVLTGRGGIGKSKLIHDWTRRTAGWTVLFKKERVSIHAQSELELRGDHILVIADDAHRQSDLEALLQLIRDKRNDSVNIKCVLSARPVGLERIDAALSRSFDPKSIARLKELQQLTPEEVRELAAEVLGPAHSNLIPFLAAASEDTPLVTVIGGRLLARGAVTGAGLASHEEFRRVVFDRILDDLEAVAKSSDRNPRSLLHLISALQPVVLRTEQSIADLARFLGWKEHQVAQTVDKLESCGLLGRSGNLYRLIPDLFADFLLEQATVSRQGESTKFADAVYQAFGREYLSNLLQNLAELDFHVVSKGGESLLDHVWADIERSFRTAGASDRVFILENVTNAAFFQPAQVMELVRIAMADESIPVDDAVEDEPKLGTSNHDVLALLPTILRATAYQPKFRRESLDRLWVLTKRDLARSYPHRDPAAKMLKTLASYSCYKSVEINQDMANLAASLVEEEEAFSRHFTPLDIVDELMEREGEENESIGMKLILWSFELKYEVVKPVRETCFSVIEKCLSSPHSAIACRAFKSVDHLIRGYLTKYGRQQTERELKWQAGERSRCFSLLKQRLETEQVPLVLAREVKERLESIGALTKNEGTRKEIAAVLAELPDTPLLEMFDAFCTGDWDIRTASTSAEDLQDAMERNRERNKQAAHLMTKHYPDVNERIGVLQEFVSGAQSCNIKANGAYNFIHNLCEDREFSRELAERICSASLPPELFLAIPAVMVRLKESTPAEYLRVGLAAARSPDTAVVRNAASGVCTAVFMRGSAEDLVLLDQLAARDDQWTCEAVIRALHGLGKYPHFRREAINRLLSAKVDDTETADELCGGFFYGDIRLQSLTREDFGRLLDLLVALPELSKYSNGLHVGMVLQWGADHFPDEILRFLSRRIEETEKRREDKDWSYTVIPATPRNFSLRGTSSAAGAMPFLSEIADRIANRSPIADDLAVLFWEVATPGDGAFDLFRPLLERSAETCEAAIRAVTRGPRRIAFDYPTFTTACLEASARFGDANLDRAFARFTSNAFTVSLSESSVEQPPPDPVAGAKGSDSDSVHPLLVMLYERITNAAEANKENRPLHDDLEGWSPL